MIPGIYCQVDTFSDIPWSFIARHASAVVFYIIALIQWPGHVVSEWAGEDRPFAYSLTSLTFTLAFWCACLYHYLISAGRVDILWREGRVRAKGWIVKRSRRAHRVLLSLALAVSAMTIIQATTSTMVVNHFYIKEDEPHPKEHLILILLKVDQTLAFCLLVFVLGRLVFEPISLRKARNSVAKKEAKEANTQQLTGVSLPDESEECSICVERWANRQLKCGHLICCCCLGEIWKTEQKPTVKCPFCRKETDLARKLAISDGGTAKIFECCGEILPVDSSTNSSLPSRQSIYWFHSDATPNPISELEEVIPI